MPEQTVAPEGSFPAFYLARWRAMTDAERRATGVRSLAFMDAARAAFLEQEATPTRGTGNMPRKPGAVASAEETGQAAAVRRELEEVMLELGLDPATLKAAAKARRKRFRYLKAQGEVATVAEVVELAVLKTEDEEEARRATRSAKLEAEGVTQLHQAFGDLGLDGYSLTAKETERRARYDGKLAALRAELERATTAPAAGAEVTP